MTMQQLYDYLKEALAFFDLRFHEMDKIEVSIGGTFIMFRYEGRMASYALPVA